MTALNTGLEPVRSSMARGAADAAAKPAQMPMSRQNAFGNHGYDMYTQELVRLSGCQELKLRREKKRALVLS